METSGKFRLARAGISLFLFASVSSVQASSITDLLITEVMANPNKVSDSNGEWFELYNPTTEMFDLSGLFIKDDGSDSHQIDGTVTIQSGQYLVFARNGDTATNGGVVADYGYSGFTLSNSGDEIIFSDGTNDLFRLAYSADFDKAGVSRQLLSMTMIEANYALTASSATYGAGDAGTPGTSGSFSPVIPAANTGSTVPLPPTLLLFAGGMLALWPHTKRWVRCQRCSAGKP